MDVVVVLLLLVLMLVVVVVVVLFVSHPTVGLHRQSLGSSHEELIISPEKWLRRHSFAQPDQAFMPKS